MKTLAEIYKKHSVTGPDIGHGDKGGTHSYIESYEELLAPYRESCSFLEIGLALGLSVAMWDEYFGHDANLHGADIGVVFDTRQFPRWDIFEADATKPGFLDIIGRQTFDVIIDDGSHMTADQIASRDLLLPRMNKGGLYIIEDILSLENDRAKHAGAEIRDLRGVKGRFDDVLIIYHT